MERTIWWQNDVALMSNRSSLPESAWPSLSAGPVTPCGSSRPEPPRARPFPFPSGPVQIAEISELSVQEGRHAPSCVKDPPRYRRLLRVTRWPTAERAEVVLSEKRIGRRSHRPQVERVRDVPHEAGEEGVRFGGLEYQVTV